MKANRCDTAFPSFLVLRTNGVLPATGVILQPWEKGGGGLKIQSGKKERTQGMGNTHERQYHPWDITLLSIWQAGLWPSDVHILYLQTVNTLLTCSRRLCSCETMKGFVIGRLACITQVHPMSSLGGGRRTTVRQVSKDGEERRCCADGLEGGESLVPFHY